MIYFVHMRHILIPLALCVGIVAGRFSVPLSVAAQTTSPLTQIPIGNASVHLGMAKADVMAKFGSGFEITEDPEDAVIVRRKPTLPGGDYETLADLAFSKGKLAFVSKSWAANQKRLESFWNGLFDCVSNAIGQSDARIIINRVSTSNKNMKDESLNFYLADRLISVSRVEVLINPRDVYYTVEERFKE